MLSSLAAVAALILVPAAASAATITPTIFTDEDAANVDCSLREAVTAANTDGNYNGCVAVGAMADEDADTIALQSGMTYTLGGAGLNGVDDGNAKGDLDILNEPVTIEASGPGRATIDANGGVTGDRVLEVDPTASGASLTVTNLAITDGAVETGTGIWSHSGGLTVTDSRIFGNNSVANAGSGLRLEGGGTITNSSIDSNTGGMGIFLEFGGLTVTGSTISDNSETALSGSGGGITKGNGSTLTMVNSTVSGNSSTVGGGGIFQFGGGILNLRNATIAGNTADSDSGAPGDFVGNGGGVFISSGTANVRNSIIADNIDGSAPLQPDCSGTIISELHNVIGNATGCTGVDPQDDFQGASSVTAPLAANGGLTDTRALLAGSVFINPDASIFTGPGPGQPCESTDQRGQPRGGAAGACDPGAFEAQPPALAAVGNKSVEAGQTLMFTVSATDPDPADTLALSASNLPSGATFTPGTGTFSWMPTAAQVGSSPVVHFSVGDGTFSDAEDVAITVTAVPPPGGTGQPSTPTAPKKKCKKKKHRAASAKKCKKKRK
jgi:CSLREA domain-containing protein